MENLYYIFLAALLGVVEGLTEFIPVSSTAHLLLVSHLLGFEVIKGGLFEVVIQIGAIFAVVWFYRKKLFTVAFNLKQKSNQKFALNLFCALLPSIAVGLIFHPLIKKAFDSNLIIAAALVLGGIVMLLVEKFHREKPAALASVDKVSTKTAILIGLCQSLAVIPGVSRSGATIIGGMLLGLKRSAAAEFSFFLAIPTIFAAAVYDLCKLHLELSSANLSILFIGIISSFISALIVIKWFIAYISRHNFNIFALYRIAVGLLVIILVLKKVILY